MRKREPFSRDTKRRTLRKEEAILRPPLPLEFIGRRSSAAMKAMKRAHSAFGTILYRSSKSDPFWVVPMDGDGTKRPEGISAPTPGRWVPSWKLVEGSNSAVAVRWIASDAWSVSYGSLTIPFKLTGQFELDFTNLEDGTPVVGATKLEVHSFYSGAWRVGFEEDPPESMDIEIGIVGTRLKKHASLANAAGSWGGGLYGYGSAFVFDAKTANVKVWWTGGNRTAGNRLHLAMSLHHWDTSMPW